MLPSYQPRSSATDLPELLRAASPAHPIGWRLAGLYPKVDQGRPCPARGRNGWNGTVHYGRVRWNNGRGSKSLTLTLIMEWADVAKCHEVLQIRPTSSWASHPGQERMLGHPRGLGICDLGDADAHHDGTQGQGVPWSFLGSLGIPQ